MSSLARPLSCGHSLTRLLAVFFPLLGCRHARACLDAASTAKMCFQVVFSLRADTHIANRIWSGVTKSCHDVLALFHTSLLPFPRGLPNGTPLLERKKEWDIALFGAPFVAVISSLHWVGGSAINRGFLWVGSAPSSLPFSMVCARGFFVLIWHSFRSSCSGSRVRGGTGADTLVPFRLYHALRLGEC